MSLRAKITFCLMLSVSNAFAMPVSPHCVQMIELAAIHPQIYSGCDKADCNKNLRRFLELVRLSLVTHEFDWAKASVLYILLESKVWEELPFTAKNWREKGTSRMYGHVVLLLRQEINLIVDFDYGTGKEITPLPEYFKRMFGDEIPRLAVAEFPATTFVKLHPFTYVGEGLSEMSAAAWRDHVSQATFIPAANFVMQNL